jgi:hypothetical protein
VIGQFSENYTDPHMHELDRLCAAEAPEQRTYRGGRRRSGKESEISVKARKMREYRARVKASLSGGEAA